MYCSLKVFDLTVSIGKSFPGDILQCILPTAPQTLSSLSSLLTRSLVQVSSRNII